LREASQRASIQHLPEEGSQLLEILAGLDRGGWEETDDPAQPARAGGAMMDDMMIELQKGQRIRLAQVLDPGEPFVVGLHTPVPAGEVDGACFGLDVNRRVTDERYLTYFNQPITPCGGVQLAFGMGDHEGFELLLDALPAHIVRLLLITTLDGESSFADMREGHARLLQGAA
jgi:hypothetical protein